MENFEIIEKLGQGGFSKVYKVRRKIDNQIYALKKVQITNLSEKQKMNSLNEIRVLASIKSKYIVNYKEAFLDTKDSSLCLVMEFADKGDLSKRIEEQKKRGKYFNERDIWRIFIQLIKGLKSLHDLNIIHRDIKSSNIFLFSDGTAKLGDLNVCKVISDNNLGKTQAGTPFFAAPEVWSEKPYGLKSDIWSLGCVLYEIVSLKCPFSSNNMVELYNKVLIGKFSRIPKKFSSDLICIIEHMIRFEEDKRLSCDQILQCDIVKKKIRMINGNENEEENEDEDSMDNIVNGEKQKLLETIYIPNNNLMYLNNQLPKANYSQEIKFIHRSNNNLKPIKLKPDLKSVISSQKYSKYNSDGKLLHLTNIKRYSQNSNISTNLNSYFNKNMNISRNQKEININESTRSMKGPIKLTKIISSLNSINDINKINKYSSDKSINNKINIKNFSSLNSDEIKRKENKLDINELMDLKSSQTLEKEIKNHHFIDRQKLNEIIFNKKKRRSHGLKKEYNFIIKVRHDNESSEKNNVNKRYDNDNEYKQIPTDVNISENNNRLDLSPLKLNYNINNVNTISKNLSNKCIAKYDLKPDKRDFRTNFIKKEKNNNNISKNFLPVLKSSCTRNFDD